MNMHYGLFLTWGRGFTKIWESYNTDQNNLKVGDPIIDNDNQPTEEKTIAFFEQRICVSISQAVSNAFFDFAIFIAIEYQGYTIIIWEHPGSLIQTKTKRELSGINNI